MEGKKAGCHSTTPTTVSSLGSLKSQSVPPPLKILLHPGPGMIMDAKDSRQGLGLSCA